MGFFDFTKTRGYKSFMAKVYGLGASVVLIGAMFKINHYPGADIMLIIGLGTEAIIFFFSAWEPPFVEPDWSLVYPELAFQYHDVEKGAGVKRETPTQKLDEMFEKAKIDQEVLDKLGKGIEKLAENANQLGKLSDASAVTEDFTATLSAASSSAKQFGEAVAKDVDATQEYGESLKSVKDGATSLANAYTEAADVLKGDMNSTEQFAHTVKDATESAQSLANSYARSAEILEKSVSALDFTALEGDAYNQQLRKISENLAALNAIYEIQLQGTNQAVESTDKLRETMKLFLEKLELTTASTSQFSDQMETLSERMSSLNKVYGNMLTAMNING
jgi:gliding motility-associated protein GldL